MMDNTFFSEHFKIGFRGLNKNLEAGFPAIMEIMQEAGTRHTDDTAFPMQWYLENKLAFVITHLVGKIHISPVIGEEVEVFTAPAMFKGMIAKRFYKMTSKRGLLAEAFSAWILLDLDKRRPVRIPAEIGESYGPLFPYNEAADEFKIPEAKDGLSCTTDMFKAARRDADANMHVNNISYVEWAQNYVPQQIYDEKRIILMKAKYKKECLAGMSVSAKTYNLSDNDYLTNFYDSNGDVFSEIFTRWG